MNYFISSIFSSNICRINFGTIQAATKAFFFVHGILKPGPMAEIDLTLKTTKIVIVTVFVLVTIYFNFILIRSSLDIIFWATITSIPLIGLKNITTIISPYLTNFDKIKKRHILLVGLFFGKSILYHQNTASLAFIALIFIYILTEKSLKLSSKISKNIKLFIIFSLFVLTLVVAINSIINELKFVLKTFNLKGLLNEKNIKHLNDMITPNLETWIQQFKQNNNSFLYKAQKCGVNYDSLKNSIIKEKKFSEIYNIAVCLFNEYKKEIITFAQSSKPFILKMAKKIISLGESSITAFSLFVTFSSTVFIMTKRSIRPMDIIYAFLNLIDNSNYLSNEFKEIVDSLIAYYVQKFFVTGLSTFLAFSLFSMNIIAIPTIMSTISVLIPGAPTYLIPVIGVIELLFLQKPYWQMILFIIACNRIKILCDKMITLKISLINSNYYF